MKLTVLGCSGAYPTRESGTTSYLLKSGDYNLLIDAGSGTFLKLREHFDPLKLDAAIITHYHYDHIGDLGVLQYYLQLNRLEETPVLPIYGNDLDESHFEQLSLPNVTTGEAYHEHETLIIGPFNITFLRTIHPVPTFALRIYERETGKVLVFTADSGYTDKLISFADGADLFLADTYFVNGNENNKVHLTAKETGEIAQAANVKRVVLTHLKENVDKQLLAKQAQETFGKNVEIAQVDATYEI